MQAMQLSAPGGLDQLRLNEITPRAPGLGEVQVEVKATSLNFHDYAVVIGMIPAADGRIPMSDGAGVVTAVGEGVSDYAVGDRVLSYFFPHWPSAAPTCLACWVFRVIMLMASRRKASPCRLLPLVECPPISILRQRQPSPARG